MYKISKIFSSLICLTMLVCANISCMALKTQADAESFDQPAEPRAFTTITIEIYSSNGQVYAEATNDFTLFSSIVQVYVDLYSSDSYYENYTDMELVATNHIDDLDMGESLKAFANINGETKYWKGRVRYKANNDAWKTMFTSTVLYDSSGTSIQVLP